MGTKKSKAITTRRKSMLTAREFHQLAVVPPEVEWLANITNERTRRAPGSDSAPLPFLTPFHLDGVVLFVLRILPHLFIRGLETAYESCRVVERTGGQRIGKPLPYLF